ncbi:MAG: membrane protein of unknown function [Promethearchaeota archaeon]|nr:MAG: membrane protein of unknown function [Candidatus Lokiarchaeota archaeon]
MSKQNVLAYFEEFGDKMYVLAILSIVSIFTGGIVQLIMWILLLLSLKHIEKANLELNDKNLENFRSKLIYAVIISVVGFAVVFVVSGLLFFQFFQLMLGTNGTSVPELDTITMIINLALIIAVISLIVSLIGIYLVMSAWKNFHIFFKNNKEMFPESIGRDAIDGTKKLKNAYLLELISMVIGIVIILIVIIAVPLLIDLIGSAPNFTDIIGILLVALIPGVIAGILSIASFVLMILGYFSLSHLKNL